MHVEPQSRSVMLLGWKAQRLPIRRSRRSSSDQGEGAHIDRFCAPQAARRRYCRTQPALLSRCSSRVTAAAPHASGRSRAPKPSAPL